MAFSPEDYLNSACEIREAMSEDVPCSTLTHSTSAHIRALMNEDGSTDFSPEDFGF